MKRKIGKIIAPILVLLIVAITLFVIFSRSQAVPIGGTYPERLGAFTGPVGGTAQDDNIKASLDLAHTDLDAMITYDTDVLSLMGLGNGNVYYVDASVAGSTGVTWATAVGTIDAAVNLIAAATESNTGAIILVAPGHTETLGTGADGCDVDQADVTIIGLGIGENRPKIDYDTATDEFVIGNDDVAIYNLWFHANVDSVVKAIDVEANCENWKIVDCVFDTETPGTDEFDDAILTNAGCYGGLLKGNLFDMGGTTNGDTQSAICLLDADYTQIIDNRFFGDYAVAIIEQKTTAADFMVIEGNLMFNGIIGGTTGLNTLPCISVKADTTGIIVNNTLVCNVAGPEDAIVAADMYQANNTYSEYEQAGGSVPIGKSYDVDTLGLLGVSTGNVFYVDSGETSTKEDGLTWSTATDTLDEAVNLCTASVGNIILIAAGHTETLGTGADGVDIDVAGITVIGLGRGQLRPKFDYDTATDEFVLGATGDGATLINLWFHSNIDSTVKAIDVEAGCTDWAIINCLFDVETDGTDEFDDAIIIGAASDRGLIKDCQFRAGEVSNGETQSAIHFVDCDHLNIIGNQFSGDYAIANIQNETTASNQVVIKDNLIFNGIIGGNAGLNAQPGIELKDDTTGLIVNNTIACNVATPDLSIVAADCYLAGNTYSENESTGGSQPISTNYSTDPYFNRGNYFIVEPGAFDTTGTWSTVASHEVVTITGAVRIRMLVQCTTTLTDAADAATLTLGSAGNAAAWIASTSAGGAGAANQLDATEVWIDATPADLETASYATTILDFVVVGGLDVGYTIGGAALTGGVLVFHVWWEPLDSTGLCVAGAGGSL